MAEENLPVAATGDTIHLEEIELLARVGVPEEERAEPQRLTVSITLWPMAGFDGLEDDIARTIDYASACDEVRRFVGARADKLIETMAAALAAHLLATYPIARVRLELRKFVLPEVKHVAVIATRERAG